MSDKYVGPDPSIVWHVHLFRHAATGEEAVLYVHDGADPTDEMAAALYVAMRTT
jgi:hypothetical protein